LIGGLNLPILGFAQEKPPVPPWKTYKPPPHISLDGEGGSGIFGPKTIGIGENSTWEIKAYDSATSSKYLKFKIKWWGVNGKGDSPEDSKTVERGIAPSSLITTVVFDHAFTQAGIHEIDVEVSDEAGLRALGSAVVNVGGVAVVDDTVGLKKPALLPTSPLYFIKEFGRTIQTFLTFNAEKKAELKLKIAEEKLVEAQIVSEKQPDNQKGLERALRNYENQRSELKTRLEKLTETSKNPNIGDLVRKIDEKISTHKELFNQLSVKTGKPNAAIVSNKFTGLLEASGPGFQMWGTHKLSVKEVVYCVKAPCPPIEKSYLVKAVNDKVLAELKKYEGKNVSITGEAKYYDIEGGFWGIVAEEVMTPEVSNQGNIKIISPKSGDKWVQGKTYQIRWTGGAEKVSIYLTDKSLESRGASVSKSWTVDNIENKGFYDFTVPAYLKGVYKFYVSDIKGSYAYSDYFEIVSSADQANRTLKGLLEASGITFQQWGTHKLSVKEVVYCVKAPCPPIEKSYLVKAANDKVLAKLKEYEKNNLVIITGEIKYYQLEGGFLGIVAESVSLVPTQLP